MKIIAIALIKVRINAYVFVCFVLEIGTYMKVGHICWNSLYRVVSLVSGNHLLYYRKVFESCMRKYSR